MVAPTPVSAYLHSATMVKAGIYLLARLHPILGYTLPWEVMVITCGASTMLVGALMATGQHDLKRILAYSTVSVLGAVTMLLGVGTELAIKAAVVFLVAHALYKASLFMVAGNIDHETGTRDVTALGGLRRLMPVTAAAGVLAALSKAGAPPMFGFVGKELLYKAKLDIESIGALLITVAVIANILLVAMALVVATWPFFGKHRSTPKAPHEAPPSMLSGPLLLAVLGLFVGMIPGAFDQNLGSAMATAIAGKPVEMELTLWHGLSPEALLVVSLSAVTLVSGFALYRRLRGLLTHTAEGVRQLGRFGPARLYEWSLSHLYPSAGRVTRVIQSGYLRRYLLVIILSTIAMVSVPLLRAIGPDLRADRWDLRVHEAITAFLILGGAWATVRAQAWLAAVAALGAVGLGVTLVFAAFGAPDLAITQIMVEVLTVILLVLVFYHLPPAVRRSRRLVRARDGTIALAAGLMMALVVLASDAIHLDPTVSRFFGEQSLVAAYGRNVVNVILVDFRSLDTLGEITVIAVAAIGICALLRPRRRDRSDEDRSGEDPCERGGVQ
jgi:multicomponent Na+:H+ antiporter subunit A